MVIDSVLKSVSVKANLDHAFRIFTEGLGTWWPKSHHIGTSPMVEAFMECHLGGRCYSKQEDGTNCPWGTILAWDPPHRFVFAWQVSPQWKYEPDLAKCSEVEVCFTPEQDGMIRVDLEHRHFERHGEGWQSKMAMVDSPGGWNGMLNLYRERAEA